MTAVSRTVFRQLLMISTALFACRVLAQSGSLFFPGDLIPVFERWSSGVIPYPLLLVSQLVILALMLAGCVRSGQWNPGPMIIGIVKRLAQLYFLVMLLRLAISVSGVSSSPWWQMTLPAMFHLVLAGYLYCFAELHNKLPEQEEISHG